MRWKVNYLYDKVLEILGNLPAAKLLELGTGGGTLAKQAKDRGWQVTALDIEKEPFKYKHEIEFRQGDLNQGLPFGEEAFDCVVMLEVIEHLKNPSFVLSQIYRVLKPGGIFILSTPNILNLKSRLRFFFEGTYDYFREPPLDHRAFHKQGSFNPHLFAYKYPELEYILFDSGFKIEGIFASYFEPEAKMLSFFCLPLMKWQAYCKCRRAKKKSAVDYSRIFKILLSQELLCSRHLVIQGKKTG
ncbi:class I SAM-dependent methyltransferase [Candidatus Omnitrophota bacterium]